MVNPLPVVVHPRFGAGVATHQVNNNDTRQLLHQLKTAKFEVVSPGSNQATVTLNGRLYHFTRVSVSSPQSESPDNYFLSEVKTDPLDYADRQIQLVGGVLKFQASQSRVVLHRVPIQSDDPLINKAAKEVFELWAEQAFTANSRN